MRDNFTPLYPASAVRALDDQAIRVHGVPGYSLMQRAGQAVFEAIQSRYAEARNLLLYCGGGNNGGDGYVIARLAKQAGWSARVVAVKPPDELSGDAKTAAQDWLQAGGECLPADQLEQAWGAAADVIVDALLGTGLDRPVEGIYRDLIQHIRMQTAPVAAVDLPSGLNADSGRIMGAAVEAELSVTFIGRKQGMYTADGPDCCGEIVFDDLAAPAEIYQAVPHEAALLQSACRDFGKRKRNSHKGDFGRLLVIGGGKGMSGAARLCAEAALRTGAALVTVATDPDHAASLNLGRPELMVRGVSDAGALAPLMAAADVVCVGPGLGQEHWGRSLWQMVSGLNKPMVVDADALNLLATAPTRREQWILTPHPGEAARLLGISGAAVQQDRFSAVRELARRYGGSVILKGCGTLVQDQDGPTGVCASGNPGMASGGMGDLLTGIIGALLAQGWSRQDAACSGVWLHAAAGDLAAAGEGERGLLASDLLPYVRQLVN